MRVASRETTAWLRTSTGPAAGELLEVRGTVVGAIGQAPVALPGLEGLARDDRGRLLTRPDLSVAEGIWAAGDCTNGLYHQNNIAAGDAVKAVEDIYLYLKAH